MNTLYLDAQFTKSQIAKLRFDYPELDEDFELMVGTLEGETDAIKIIERALEQRQEAAMMAGAMQARLATMFERQGRFARKSEAMKMLIKSIMKAANIVKLTLPEATLSITKARETVGIIDIDELPQGYFKTIRQADKAAIKDALAGGQDVPGAALVIGVEGLTIRPK